MGIKLERGMVKETQRPYLPVLVFLFLSLPVFSQELVLVASSAADYKIPTLFEVRKLFFGYPIQRNNIPLNAIINKSNEAGYQIFLQKVIHLSARNYERRMLSKTFRTGSPAVQEVATLSALKNKLASNKFSVSVMWRKEVEQEPNLKIIQVLWKEKQ